MITLPILLLVSCVILIARLAEFAWDAATDMLTKPFNTDYMITWATSFVFALSLIGLLGYLAYISCLTIARGGY